MLDSFWNNTDSCLKTMMITDKEFKRLDSRPLRRCGQRRRCQSNSHPLSLPNEIVVFEDYRPLIYGIQYYHKFSDTVKVVNSLTLSEKFKSLNSLMKVLYRIILNPSQDVQSLIFQQLKSYPASFVGMHIRSAGQLANRKERVYWLKENELPKLKNFISNTISRKHLSKNIYLSTDSDKVEKYLKNQLPGFKFLNRLSLKRDHSTSNASADVLKGAIFDSFVAAQSTSLFYTKDSSFSMIVTNLCKSHVQLAIPFQKRT